MTTPHLSDRQDDRRLIECICPILNGHRPFFLDIL